MQHPAPPTSAAPFAKTKWIAIVERVIALATIALLFCAYAASAAAASAEAEEGAPASHNYAASIDPSLTGTVRDVLQHEIRAQAEDESRWCYRKLVEKDGKRQLFAACQTKGAEIDRLMAEDGKPLSQKQWQQENQRIDKLLGNNDQLRKEKQQQLDDEKQATNLLRMIPEAFLFQQQKKDAERVELRFVPNPKFRPSGYSEMVFHHMEGTLTLDLQQRRLVEISGRLDSEVKFAAGLFGHLDKGGTFYVRQQEVTPGRWVMIKMDVQMNGRALFFKTIGVREVETDTDFHPVPAHASLQQLAALTNQSDDKSPLRTQR